MRAVWLRRTLYLAGIAGLLPIVLNYVLEALEFLGDVYESVPVGLRISVWLILLAFAAAALLAGRFKPDLAGRIPKFDARWAGRQFALGLVSIAFLHGELDDDAGLIVVSSLAILFVLIALYAHGRDRAAIRYVSYVVFAGEILVVYGETVYSMVGTSGFFLALGVVLALIACAVYGLERRWKARRRKEKASA